MIWLSAIGHIIEVFVILWLAWKIENLLKFRLQAFEWMQDKEDDLVRIKRSLTREQLLAYNTALKCTKCGETVLKETKRKHDGQLLCSTCNLTQEASRVA